MTGSTDIDGRILAAPILIVDDTPANVELLDMMLRMAGYEDVTATTDSRQVEGLFRERSYDLLLLDIRMPHLDGFQVMEGLSARIRGDYLPILVLTAQQDRETRIRALRMGAKDFVTKPFDQTEVLNRIRNMLEVRTLYNDRRRQAEVLERAVQQRTRELAQKTEDLEHAQVEIIRTLSRASEYRDTDTGFHVVRVGRTSRLLALAYGLSEADADLIELAAPLHDVGKVGIPDQILLKPGRLDDDELSIMKTHSVIGRRILGDYPSRLLEMARTIACSHHEKWDGSGYPRGLAGDAIPIEGRIAAVADVFDALVSNRPYKKGWPVDDAVAFVKDQARRQFDPAVVDAFMNVLPDILAVQTELAG